MFGGISTSPAAAPVGIRTSCVLLMPAMLLGEVGAAGLQRHPPRPAPTCRPGGLLGGCRQAPTGLKGPHCLGVGPEFPPLLQGAGGAAGPWLHGDLSRTCFCSCLCRSTSPSSLGRDRLLCVKRRACHSWSWTHVPRVPSVTSDQGPQTGPCSHPDAALGCKSHTTQATFQVRSSVGSRMVPQSRDSPPEETRPHHVAPAAHLAPAPPAAPHSGSPRSVMPCPLSRAPEACPAAPPSGFAF